MTLAFVTEGSIWAGPGRLAVNVNIFSVRRAGDGVHTPCLGADDGRVGDERVAALVAAKEARGRALSPRQQHAGVLSCAHLLAYAGGLRRGWCDV